LKRFEVGELIPDLGFFKSTFVAGIKKPRGGSLCPQT